MYFFMSSIWYYIRNLTEVSYFTIAYNKFNKATDIDI